MPLLNALFSHPMPSPSTYASTVSAVDQQVAVTPFAVRAWGVGAFGDV